MAERTQSKLYQDIGTEFRVRRQNQGLTLEEVAEALKIKVHVLMYIETGWATFDEYWSNISQLSQILGLLHS